MAAHSFAWNYTTLVAALKAWVEDTGTDFGTNVDTCIGLGELGLLRDLDLDIFDSTATGTFTPGNQQVTKPTGFVADRTLSYVKSGRTTVLTLRSREFLLDYWPVASSMTDPKYYADLNDTTWLVAGTPQSNYTWTAYFMLRPNQLSSDTATNWLGTNCPDALFYACLNYSAEYLKQAESFALWQSDYQQALAKAREETRHHRRKDYAPTTMAPMPRGER